MTDICDDKGPWHWFSGSDEDDSEMAQADSRDEAIRMGRESSPGEDFYIVEACFLIEHEDEMDAGVRDTAPFAAMRNGEWIEHQPKDNPQ